MTHRQILKKLTNAGIVASDSVHVEACRDEVTVAVFDTTDVSSWNGQFRVDNDATNMLMKRVAVILGWTEWHAVSRAWGGFVVRPGASVPDGEGIYSRANY